MIPGDPRYDPAARRKKIADLKVKENKILLMESKRQDASFDIYFVPILDNNFFQFHSYSLFVFVTQCNI